MTTTPAVQFDLHDIDTTVRTLRAITERTTAYSSASDAVCCPARSAS